MTLDEASYFTRRALFQFDRASAADDESIASVHARLSDLYLERARAIVAEQTMGDWPDNVVPLRATA